MRYIARVRGCAGARVRGCAGARVRGCAGARVRGCAGARVRESIPCARDSEKFFTIPQKLLTKLSHSDTIRYGLKATLGNEDNECQRVETKRIER